MRVKYSEISTIGFYPTLKDVCCRNKKTPLAFPSIEDVNFQLIFGNQPGGFISADIYNDRNELQSATGLGEIIAEDVNKDGETEYFLQVNGQAGAIRLSGCAFYFKLRITVDGRSKEIYSDFWRICENLCYRLEYSLDCDSKDFGYFSNGWKNKLYFQRFNAGTPTINENLEQLINGNNQTKTEYGTISAKLHDGNTK